MLDNTKILHVSPVFVPSRLNGTKMVAYSLARAFVKRGYNVTVYATDVDVGHVGIPGIKEVEDLEGIRVRYLRNLNNYIAYRFRLFLPIGLIAVAKKELNMFSIIHLHDFRGFHNIVIYHYSKKYKIPYIIDAHGSTPRLSGGKSGIKWLLRGVFDLVFGYRLLRDAGKVVAETELGVNEYEELGVSQSKIALIAPPFPIEDFSQLPPYGSFRQKYDIKERHVVLFLGRINYIKGIDFLIESFYELAKTRDDIVLVLVGPDDGYKSTLEKLIAKLNISGKVLFAGFLDGEDKLSAYVDADMLVQTSRYEQGAWVPFEAVLCNTPIIVSSNSGAGEDVKRIDAGYLVEYGNIDDLKNKMNYILDAPGEAAIKTGNAAEYIRTHLSLSENIVKYEQIYSECIGVPTSHD